MNMNLDYSTLFSSFNNSRTSGSTGSTGMGSILADYSAIRNGSYGKLLRAYYNLTDDSSDKKSGNSVSKFHTSTAADSTATIKEIQSTTDDLSASAKELYTSGSKSVFKKVEAEDEQGKKTMQYDTDAIYKSVKAFVDDYNRVIDAAEDSSDSKIQNSVTGMVNYTKMEANMLGKVGITINEDQQLELDEKAFKKADMDAAKSLFNGNGSYAYMIATKAEMTNSYADMEATKANTYNKYGNYGSANQAGALYNSYF